MIRITAKVPGFRRCGVAHPAEATDYPNEAFTKEQLAVLQAEPMLAVEVNSKKLPQVPADTDPSETDPPKE